MSFLNTLSYRFITHYKGNTRVHVASLTYNLWLFALFFVVLRFPLPKVKTKILFFAGLLFCLFHSGYDLLFVLSLGSIQYLLLRKFDKLSPSLQKNILFFYPLSLFLLLFSVKVIQGNIEKEILPLGASYLIFQCVGSLVDISKKQIEAPKSFLRYFASFSFFPVITAGPITNTMATYKQLEEEKVISYKDFRFYVLLILGGFCKKMIADLLFLQVDDLLTNFPLQRTMAWIDIMAIVARFYADFSGYTDIAIGSAGLLGIQVPANFKVPFLSRSIAEFWQRWHMSLTGWTTKYLFYPLLFKLKSLSISIPPRLMTNIAIICTMVFIGLWHSMSLNYLIWGIYYGTLIILSPFIMKLTSKLGSRASVVVDVALTFILICIGQVFAGSEGLGHALNLLSVATFSPVLDTSWPYFKIVTGILVMLSLVIPHIFDYFMIYRKEKIVSPIIWGLLVCFFILFSIVIGAPAKPFQYGNF